jgi:alkylation response protein AidB-like acyl-CoA dehydrogenase
MNQGKLQIPAQYIAAEALEQYLGDPMDPENLFSFRRSMELDEREEYPHDLIDLINQWNLHLYYIPAEYGGKLESFEVLLSFARVLARRDLTVQVAHGVSFLGSLAVWLSGTDTQKRRVAELIKNKGSLGLAITEETHGADILANDVEASKVADGYQLSGEKWTFGNARRGMAFTLLAKTAIHGGPRGFSIFLVEKNGLDASKYSNLPKMKTLGLRGHDLSGIQFDGTPIPAESLIGPVGAGVEVVFKSLQITRTMCGGLSLGAADTALRVTLHFALTRILYGGSVFSIPHARSVLADAFLDILICDCVTISAARACHVSTNQLSVWSAVVKYFVPVTIERTIHDLSVVLGARFFMRDSYCWGIFQKALRDVAIVSVFEGNTVVQLNTIGLQLQHLLDRCRKIDQDHDELCARLESIFCLQKPIPDFINPANLDLHSHGYNDAVQGIDIARSHLHALKCESYDDSKIVEAILALTNTLGEEANDLADVVRNNPQASDKTAELFELSRRFCVLHAAAACVHMWIYNRKFLGDFFAKGQWLVLSLNKLLRRQHPSRGFCEPSYVANVAQELLALYREDKLFSIVPLQVVHKSRTRSRCAASER